jgi:D-glycero-D-manno-heptose 1,7-bisphosphate phosphatase
MLSKAVFLDKDGTLVDDIPYNVDLDLIQLAEGALEGLRLLQEQNYQLFVVTNQSGVARGYFEEQALSAVEKRLQELLSAAEVQLSGFYYCPHHPAGNIPQYSVVCSCRKPQPGLLQKAALEHRINLAASWLVGDILNDVEAGNRAGCRTVLIDNGNETEWVLNPRRHPDFMVKNLYEAAATIVRESPQERNLSYGEKEHGSSKYYR